MPYNTRRKSVSLASLGIAIPASAKHQRPSPPADSSEQPPMKKFKRVHHEPVVVRHNLGPTPPPSPQSYRDQHISYEDIDDEVVSAVVKVIERSGNRPHTARELVNCFANSSGVALIDNSANPHAIISSRLNTYLKRKDFGSDKPCVLEKELIVTHPKRTYFFLTTSEHQPIPEHFEHPLPIRAVVSPAPTNEEEEEEERRRRIPSPSPELDFFDHNDESGAEDLDETTSIFSRDRSGSPSSRNSPPLEGDEQEFSDNAISLSIKHRSASRDLREGVLTPPTVLEEGQHQEHDHEHEHHTTFLGSYTIHSNALPQPSPIVRPVSPKAEGSTPNSNPKALGLITSLRLNDSSEGVLESWGELKSPETVNLQELDMLLGGL